MGEGSALRYPPEIAPFAAIGAHSQDAMEHLKSLVTPGERVGILGLLPDSQEGWVVQKSLDLAQYVWEHPEAQVSDSARPVPLTESHVDRMLELTALVYPSYFRRGTAQLGQYFGVMDGDRLCAMAGVRLAMDGFAEISGVCTHPEYRGRGYAGLVSMRVAQHILEQGDQPFLHTEFDNHVAQSVYERLGFTLRRMIPFMVLDRISG